MSATLTQMNRTPRYQEGSLTVVARAKGPNVWVYRWRELDDGKRIQRKRVIGTVEQLKNISDAKREVDNLRCEVNAQDQRSSKMTVGDAWGHFQGNELCDGHVDRSETTIERYRQVFKDNILPTWESIPLDEVKTVAVEMATRTGFGERN